MPVCLSHIARRALILVFATISMFICVTGSTIAHTTGELTAIVNVGDHGHHDGDGSSMMHGTAHQSGTADHTHDGPGFALTADLLRAVITPTWDGADASMESFGMSGTMDRPPRL